MNDPAPESHPASLDIARLLAQCEIRRTRRSGPGGQHRNKVETAIVIVHTPTGIKGEASERRSQDLNRQQAIQRLRVNLALGVRCSQRAGELPSTLWQSRARGGKISVSGEHEDYPALLAEALDMLAYCDERLPAAAERLEVSPSQLTKFLKQHPHALAQLNATRRERGLRPLQ